jgi:hypothetical protein
MGIMYTSETASHATVNYVVNNSSSWVYAGTGFHDGDVVAGIVGYETDRYNSNYPAPNAVSQTLLSNSPYTNTSGGADYSNSSIYQAPSGAWVFATGTMSWSWALDNYAHASVPIDPRVQQATANVLNAFLPPPPTVHDLKLTAPATAVAGQAFSVSVMAEDAQGNPVTSYSGSVHFSSSDASSGVILPPDSTLSNGQGSFSATLIRAGPQTLSVSDAANNLSTTANLSVNAAATSRLALSSGSGSVSAGSSFSFTVTALDPYGNTASGYAGTLHFTTSDPSPLAMPADSTLSNGQGTFSATLRTAGAQTISGTDTGAGSIRGSLTVQVIPATAASITWGIPGTVQANQPFTITVTVKDQFGNLASGYRGTLHFSSSDLAAQLPADYAFSAADAGSRSFSVTLRTPPSQTLTATDTVNAGLTATTRAINVILL